MIETREAISVKEAIGKVMDKVTVGKSEQIPLQLAYGRYIAEDVHADHDVPLFDRSMMDGFAIRAEDTHNERSTLLKVVEEIGAGYVASESISSGEAIRIMTGAPIPQGADTVIMLEEVTSLERDAHTYIEIKRSCDAGEHISPQGEDILKGAVLIRKGRRVDAGVMALLATFGYSEVDVYKQPVIGILATGTELVDV